MQTFAELKNRYVIDCTLVSDTAIHVGSGEASDVADSTVLRQAGLPLVPGSSMRGSLRSLLERMLLSLRLPSPVNPCVLFAEPDAIKGLFAEPAAPGAPDPDAPICAASNKLFLKLSAEEQDRMIARDKVVLCDICQLFGSAVMAGRLKTLDATPSVAAGTAPVFTVRHGVGINRDTQTAQEHIKYEFEVAEKGPAYSFRLILENATHRDFALLYILLMEMKQGFAVGGKKNQGLGQMKLASYSVSYFDPDSLVEPFSLRAFLAARGTLKDIDVSQFEAQLSAWFEDVCPAEGA